jgi:esterase/lipase superfamily enzyme
MMDAMAWQIDNGWLQVYCVDSVDGESWYNWGAHPGYRAWRQTQYDNYLYHEVLPLMAVKNSNPFTITTGASFGAYHAMTFGLRHPDAIGRVLGMSGIYDIRGWTDGWTGEQVYLNNPVEFIPGERDAHRLGQLQRMDIIIVGGKDDRLIHSSRQMSGVLWGKGIGNALREWDGWAHDWPYWKQMVNLYMNGA